MRQNINLPVELEYTDFDTDKLVATLHKESIPVESVIDLVNECLTKEFTEALDGIEVSGSCYFSRGCYYLSNGDPGYPDESGIEDVWLDNVSFFGKKFDVTDCLTDKMTERLEEKLWERFNEE